MNIDDQERSDRDQISAADYVENTGDAVEVSNQLLSLLCGAGTSVNEDGEFVMDQEHFNGFVALLRHNRYLVGKKLRRPPKKRPRRALTDIPFEEIEDAYTLQNRGRLEHFGLGTTFRAKMSLGRYPALPIDSTDLDVNSHVQSNDSLKVGDVVLYKPSDGSALWPGEILNPDDAPPIVRTIKPKDDRVYRLIVVYPHGAFEWCTESTLSVANASGLREYEQHAASSVARSAFRIALEPTKWRKTFRASLSTMINARKELDTERKVLTKAKTETPGPESTLGDDDEGREESEDVDMADEYMPKRTLRSHAHILGPTRYVPGDLVVAKTSGHPFWPGKIVDRHAIPYDVATDCTDRDDPNLYPIRFFPEGDYYWVRSNEIQHLDMDRIKKFIRETRSNFGPLLDGYKIASDPREWEADNPVTDELVDVDKIELPSREESNATEGNSKRKRKRGHDDVEDVKSKKRVAGGKDDNGESRLREGSQAEGRASLESGLVKIEGASVEPDEQGQLGRPALTPEDEGPVDIHKSAHRVRKLRWMIQRTFFNGEVQQGFYEEVDRGLFQLEGLTTVTTYILEYSKIQKVLNNLVKLEEIPNESSYRFRERARKLLGQWTPLLNKKQSLSPDPLTALPPPENISPMTPFPMISLALNPKDVEITI